ncbi:hypothetical protein NE237_010506 [Protea cynaroides]|uniref:Uncharacterized protein n=1 Tax=Protea cynaroides TaxID=273540 RepID=A0A9Q0L0D6_9MAGN|nr:hypothetical protein NE237_010506 [Protea cynaroides]
MNERVSTERWEKLSVSCWGCVSLVGRKGGNRKEVAGRRRLADTRNGDFNRRREKRGVASENKEREGLRYEKEEDTAKKQKEKEDTSGRSRKRMKRGLLGFSCTTIASPKPHQKAREEDVNYCDRE